MVLFNRSHHLPPSGYSSSEKRRVPAGGEATPILSSRSVITNGKGLPDQAWHDLTCLQVSDSTGISEKINKTR
ncbi:hypothetical protein [Bacteroides sp. 51]|uniref:hypothetical protein n=1 Tax=Bacteroides sp. 51 TaxID=2302938 RepID=UPI0019402D03|nr:hypothetical protein [Bacteroides sp. 51]